MGCDNGWVLCELANWLQHHGEELKEAAKPVAVFFNLQLAPLSPLFSRIGENIEWIIALFSASFGVWRWWVYRESILHERLRAFITDSDARLEPTYRDIVRVVSRPDRRTRLRQPAFASELAVVLKRNRWEPVLRLDGGTHFVERQLASAVRSIDNRIDIAQRSLTSLRDQRAAADTISAAIAASRAARARDPHRANRLDQDALDSYRRVLQLPGRPKDHVAKEGEAQQLLRLGHLAEAARAFAELEELTDRIPDDKQRAFIKSRAMRSRALILQAEAPAGSLTAYGLVSCTMPGSAISIRAPFLPAIGWDALELADICYAGAYLSHRLGYGVVEVTHISMANANYQRVLDANSSTLARLSKHKRQLRECANAGIGRIERAKSGNGYDLKFLYQPA